VTSATGPNGAVVYFSVTAYGGCDAPSVTLKPPSGSIFPWGTTTVTATASDQCGNTNRCSFTVTVNPTVVTADLQVAKFADQSTVSVSNLVTFSIVVSNGGPAAVNNVLVPESLSPGWSFVGVSNGPNASFDFASRQWTILSLPPYAEEVLALQAQAVATGWLSNLVTVVPPPGVTDPNPANNSSLLAVLAVPAAPMADLKLTKVANTNLAEVTNAITFSLTVENLGPNDAANITVKELPASYLYISGLPEAPAGTSWDPPSRTWTITKLAANASVTLQVAALPLRGGAYTNTAAILASQTPDPNLNNNTSSVPATFVGYAACGAAALCQLGGPPHANAKVTLIPPTGLLTAGSFTTTTDARGAFCLTNLLPGTYTLKVEPADPTSGIGVYQQPVVVGPDTGFLTPWSSWAIVAGQITFGPGGPPYPNVTVTATSADGTITKTANTDQNGTFLITGLADNTTYTVTATPPVNGLSFVPAKATVTVGAGGTSCPPSASFVVQGQLKISGRTRGCVANGPVVPYATVTLGTAQFPNLKTVMSGSDGSYSFVNLPPGAYTLTATHPTFTFNPKQVNLGPGNASADLLGTQGTSVGGRVLDRSRAPLANVQVTLTGPLPMQNQQKTTTDANGVFVINNLAAGLYQAVPAPPQANFAFNPPGANLWVGNANACQSYAIFVGTLNAVELVALEVVQVCQDWQNNMPLVAGKPTLVRAFLKPAGSSTNPVPINNAKLMAVNAGGTTSVNPRWPITATPNYAQQRNSPKTCLAFDVPAAWTSGQITFTLQWPGGVLTTYMDPAGQQTAVRNNATTVQFQKTPALPIKWVLVNWTFGDAKGQATDANLTLQRRRLLAALPTISIPPGQNNTHALNWDPPSDPTNIQGDPDEEKLMNNLQGALARLRRVEEIAPDRSRTVYHGVVTGTKMRSQAGGIPGTTSYADMSQDPMGAFKNVAPHELGHVLGQSHDVNSAFGIAVKATLQLKTGLCAEDALITAPDYPMDQHLTDALAPTLGPMGLGNYRYVYAWDASDQTWISPFGTADLMSYCKWTSIWQWPGSYTYTNLFADLPRRFGPAAKLRAIPKTGPVPCWVISGQVEETSNTLNWDPLVAVVRPDAPTPPDPGPYTLLLLDSAGNVLASVPFAPTVPVSEEDETTNLLYAYFAFDVRQMTGVAAAQILYQGVTLTNRTASPHPPVVNFTSPSPGAVLTTDPIPVAWSGSAANGLPLTYLLQYTADGGTNWETVALDIATNALRIASETLQGSTNAYLRVTACDGMNQASALTGPLTVPEPAPQVEIVQPVPGDTITGQEPVILRADGWDMQDGELASTQFQWTDSVSGSLGTGGELVLDPAQFSEGSHVFTVTATDSAGEQSTASVQVTVQRAITVPLSATLVGDGVELSWPAWAANLTAWATFSLASPDWFLVEGLPVESGDNLVLDVSLLEDEMFFRLDEP